MAWKRSSLDSPYTHSITGGGWDHSTVFCCIVLFCFVLCTCPLFRCNVSCSVCLLVLSMLSFVLL